MAQAKKVKEVKNDGTPGYFFRGGSTLIVDLTRGEIKYQIVKSIKSDKRQERTADFVREATRDPLRSLFFSPDRPEPFAALHSLADDAF